MNIDFQKWGQIIKKPDWYFEIISDAQQASKLKETNLQEAKRIKEKIYDFFETNLIQENIVLGTTGKNWDAERKPIDTIVIHHTAMNSGLSLNRLSAVILFRLYASYYANPYNPEDKEIKGQPIYSGHFRNGKQIFWPYHWIVREGGVVERLLHDDEIGWQAGKWDVNCKSVAIVLDNNYEDTVPPTDELDAVAKIIKEHYSYIKKKNIVGHREVNPQTTCPSNLFLSHDDIKGWKENLLERI